MIYRYSLLDWGSYLLVIAQRFYEWVLNFANFFFFPDNRIKNIYSQAEKQSQIKLQGVPKNLLSMFRIKRNLKRASEIYNSLGVLVKKKGLSLLANSINSNRLKWLAVLLKSSIFCLIFCLFVLYITERLVF